ncbi:anaerobic ribonucleoside-triphosphate reductase [Pontibacterium granulatum]|uniref:anaerobic ribonucleoside-triphosphate reductase n=1 Tax=Pontibacterium granulatum TaxID=2036029 RepID=UPI00249BB644|nr:anaerobic ribonucleoside-triphosphate reductase [Pontibacterium granulatum]MDI3326409.1 anaerobic ribonucleoside-triphosphate reductase [Pontibacterium granulatum]
MNAHIDEANTLLKPEERQRCEVWTRVMGYHRPVAQFNAGKKAEHAERCHFVETKA